MKAFTIIANAVGDTDALLSRLEKYDGPSVPKQTGFPLHRVAGVEVFFASLTRSVSRHFNRQMHLRLDCSSYRVQPPNSDSALQLHQDWDALTIWRKGRGKWVELGNWRNNCKHWLRSWIWPVEYLSTPGQECCCTVWMPLVTIDEATPSLELSPQLPPGRVEMVGDDNGYSVVTDAKAFRDWPLVALTHLAAGDGVVFGPRTLHRTYVRPWHTKTRHSVDLRFFSQP